MFTPNFCLKCKGTIFALDKSASKINQIQDNSARLGLSNITAFVFDSTAACIMEESKQFQEYDATELVSPLPTSPPFLPNSFDRILLDAPCSALGQRPQLYNPIRLKEVQSFARFEMFCYYFLFLILIYIFGFKDCRKSFFLR
jgi:16S rRNA C967 or C1407 C5-methylase (RsmB/RsmF family)